jgi:NitT/TauT family transport system ATP-binding protein
MPLRVVRTTVPPAANMPADSSAYVSLRGVAKTYRRGGRETRALAAVDLEVREGEFLAIVGP